MILQAWCLSTTACGTLVGVWIPAGTTSYQVQGKTFLATWLKAEHCLWVTVRAIIIVVTLSSFLSQTKPLPTLLLSRDGRMSSTLRSFLVFPLFFRIKLMFLTGDTSTGFCPAHFCVRFLTDMFPTNHSFPADMSDSHSTQAEWAKVEVKSAEKLCCTSWVQTGPWRFVLSCRWQSLCFILRNLL